MQTKTSNNISRLRQFPFDSHQRRYHGNADWSMSEDIGASYNYGYVLKQSLSTDIVIFFLILEAVKYTTM